MKWSIELAKHASDYAKLLVKDNGCEMSHTYDGHDDKFLSPLHIGENLSGGKGSPKRIDKFEAGRLALKGWGEEGFGNDRTGSMTGHYTAMMWQDNVEVGCGYSHNDAIGCIMTGCLYISKTVPTNTPSSMERPMNTNKKGGPIWQPMVVPDQVRCTRPITIDKVNAVNFLPKDLALTKPDAKKRHFKDEEWDSPDEEWAEAREKNGGNTDIKSWPGSGDKLRMITYPGTTNHEDILEGSKYASYMMKIHRKIRHFCKGDNKRLKWDNKLAKYASDYAKLLVKENGCGESKSFKGHDPKKRLWG